MLTTIATVAINKITFLSSKPIIFQVFTSCLVAPPIIPGPLSLDSHTSSSFYHHHRYFIHNLFFI